MASMGSSKRNKVYDQQRKSWVAGAPEELVRQRLLSRLIGDLGFPKERIIVERSLQQFVAEKCPNRRIDVVCLAPASEAGFVPLFVIECKKDHHSLEEAVQQLIGYNYFLKAPYLGVVSAERAFHWHFNAQSVTEGLPNYTDLLEKVADG